MASPTTTTRMEHHPDIAAMRMPYERMAESRPTQFTSGLAFLAGVYLAISPWVVGFANLSSITVNNLITGIAAALLAAGYASAFGRTHGLSWVLPLIGVWTIISPWVVRGNVDTTPVIWNNIVVGAVIVLFGLLTAITSMRGDRMARRMMR